MAICEFSGDETEQLVEVEIEGVRMKVAPQYAKYGKRVQTTKPAVRVKREARRPSERTERVRSDAARILRAAFQNQEADEESIARSIGMKESQLKGYLRGDRAIPIKDARTLERTFNVTIIQTEAPTGEEAANYSSSGGGALTFGDLLKGAKRR